jgi:hypothetical protein
MTIPFLFCASVTAISAIISLGFYRRSGRGIDPALFDCNIEMLSAR